MNVFILALILISGLIWFLTDRWSRTKLEEACEEWPLIDRSLADFSQVFPRTSKNQSAQVLDDLYQQIRLNISADSDKKTKPSSQEDREAVSAMREYLEKELERPTIFIEAPPADVIAVLIYNKDVLDDIAHRLVNKELPKLPLDVEAGYAMAVPNLLWQIHLNRLLIIQALLLQANEKTDQAWSYLHASARLADSSFAQPELISQFIAIAETGYTLLAMRKMSVPIPSWAVSWPTHDLEYGMTMAFTAEARSILTIVDTTELISMIKAINRIKLELGEYPLEIGIGTRILSSVVGRPYLRLCAAYIVAALKQSIRNRMQEGLCTDQPSRVPTLNELLPGWVASSLLGKMLNIDYPEKVGFFNQAWYRLHRILICQAGTRGILAAKAAKFESPLKHWPETLSGIGLPCERLSWLYTVASDGSVTFQYSKQLPTLLPEIPAGHLTYIGGAEE